MIYISIAIVIISAIAAATFMWYIKYMHPKTAALSEELQSQISKLVERVNALELAQGMRRPK